MVVPSPIPIRSKKTKAIGIPVIDLSADRSELAETILRACEEYGIFKVINHGVPQDTISRLEDEGFDFFAKPMMEKQRAGPANPFGYGCKNIGPNGDMGELEYLLLHSDPLSISEGSKNASADSAKFSVAVNDYIQEVRELACDILDLIGEGLWLSDKFVFSRLIRETNSDSVLRINHYPALKNNDRPPSKFDHHHQRQNYSRIGFGEHSDPQILTILRSNDVEGLQICLHDGLWISVPPDPMEFYVIVGDAMQVLSNGRLKSVRHRAMCNSFKSRMSTMYFGAPPLNAWISPLPEMVSPQTPSLFKPFTWGEFKKALYSLRLSDSRLDLFKIH